MVSRQRGFRVLFFLAPRRGFHSSMSFLDKGEKPPSCKPIGEICKDLLKPKPCTKTYAELCRREKVKCVIEKKEKPKVKKVDADICPKTCLGRPKCELLRAAPPPKMEYAKPTCPPPKFVRPEPCPPLLDCEDEGPYIEAIESTPKKVVCTPPPMPKPPCEPILLCQCPPPPKLRPGPCPCEPKEPTTGALFAKPRKVFPCPLKKKPPCPDTVHICPIEKKPCTIMRNGRCDHRKKEDENNNNDC